MPAPGRLVGFVPIADAERSTAFYRGLLGLELVKDDGFALVFRSGENMMRLVKMAAVNPAPFTIIGWQTEAIEDEVQGLTSKGVVFHRYSFLQHDDQGIWTAPGGDKVAWFADPDGNVLSLSQHV